MKMRIFTWLFSLLLLGAMASPVFGAKIVSPEAKVELTLPSGWRLQSVPGFSSEFGFGPVYDNFGTNVNLVSEPFSGSLADYVKANLVTMKGMKGFTPVSQDSLKTDSGVELTRLVTDTNMMQPLRQVFYFGKGKGQSDYGFVVTFSVAASQASKLQPVFDQAIKTLKFN